MAWARRWRIDSREKWRQVLRALLEFEVDFRRHPIELVAREERMEKTPDQRRLFHAVCADLAPQLGLTPGQAKQLVKAEFYGVDHKTVAGRTYEFTRSSEDSDREEYSRLIDFAYQWGAENGIVIAERRTR